jgi:hypothetical protein
MLAQTQKLFDVLTGLPDDQQAAFATRLLEDLEWELTLAETPETLDSLVQQAKADIRSGRTYDLGDVLEERVIPQ